ncbi:MAG: hypothetical protein M9921_06560 [Fimbriimonadaceae bacterium]|nr:hypothetical protein [Fimbriimonadaceae bacterium]
MKHLLVFLALLSLGLVAIGCGGGDEPTTETPTVNGQKPDPSNPGDNNTPGGAASQTPL